MDKPKFNFIDGAILLILILVIAAGAFLLSSKNDVPSTAPNLTAEYKIQFTKSEAYVADMFIKAAASNDKSVWVGEKERAKAEIVDVFVEPAHQLTAAPDKDFATWAEIPNLYDITVTLRSKASETDSQVKADNTPIRVGEEFVVRGKGFAGYGFLIDLELIKL